MITFDEAVEAVLVQKDSAPSRTEEELVNLQLAWVEEIRANETLCALGSEIVPQQFLNGITILGGVERSLQAVFINVLCYGISIGVMMEKAPLELEEVGNV